MRRNWRKAVVPTCASRICYAAFCLACGQDASEMASFEKFACVGGIPKYWEFIEPGQDVVALVDALYFDFAPYMEQEPQRILRDEGVIGLNALAVLEAVGRGAERPLEIAGRLATAQTNLSRLLQQLLDASVLTRGLPFGESLRSTKKTLYRIQDPTIRESGIELDIVAPDPDKHKRLLVAEVKWRRLSAVERKAVLRRLEATWDRCSLCTRHPQVRFDVLDAGMLARL